MPAKGEGDRSWRYRKWECWHE